jgi:hypothetical protein
MIKSSDTSRSYGSFHIISELTSIELPVRMAISIARASQIIASPWEKNLGVRIG